MEVGDSSSLSTSKQSASPPVHAGSEETAAPNAITGTPSSAQLFRYFLGLGTWGFGGPVALVGYMYRDLVERRRWLTEETYQLSMALAQVMPGPLAAQTAIAIGYFQGGVVGATLSGVAF